MNRNMQDVNVTKSIEDEALHWMTRRLSGAMSPEEEHRFEEWLSVPGHQAAFDSLADAAASLDDMADDLLAESFEAELEEFAERQSNAGQPWWRYAGIAATLAAVAAAGLLMLSPADPETLHFATAVGDQRTVPLEDGSRLTLNTSSTIDVTYDKAARRIALAEGEVFFDVARDPARRFTVDTGLGTVAVTGTSFNIRKDADRVRVSVISGAVDVRPATAEAVTLIAGEAVEFGPDLGAPVKLGFDATQVLSWRSGRVIFEDVPLGEVADELNRYFDTPLVLAASAPVTAPVTGEFNINDPATTIRGLSVALSLEVRRLPDAVVLSAGDEE